MESEKKQLCSVWFKSSGMWHCYQVNALVF